MPLAKFQIYLTVPFHDMWTLKFQAQPTNAFFAVVNQMFGGSSQLPTTYRRARGNQIKSFRQHSRKLGGATEQLIDGSEKTHLSVELLNFGVRMLLNGAVKKIKT